MWTRCTLGILATCALTTRPAFAQIADREPALKPTRAAVGDWNYGAKPSWRYLYDDGAIPTIYLPIAIGVVAAMIDPPQAPRGFSAAEGGESQRADTVPTWTLGVFTGAALTAIAVIPSPGNWQHAKGFAAAAATTYALTSVAKIVFGRHRPYYDPSNTAADARKSFFSGHASSSFAAATYLSLFLGHHVFAPLRARHRGWLVVEILSYAVLGGGAAAVGYSRIADHRHHLSDVLTGAAVGIAVSTGSFLWHEHLLSEDLQQQANAVNSEGAAGDSGGPFTLGWSGTF